MFSAGKTSGTSGAVALTNSYTPAATTSYLLGTTNGTPTNSALWSLSLWIKRSNVTAAAQVITANVTGPFEGLYIADSSGVIYLYLNGAIALTGPALLDTASWYHIYVTVTPGLAQMYINGSLVAFTPPFGPFVTSFYYNASGYQKIFANYAGAVNPFYGSIAGVYFTDGNNYSINKFGYNNPDTGVWQPGGPNAIAINATGAYGANGFNLLFNTPAIGRNLASAGNQFTESGARIATNYDVPPVSYNTANYAVFNPLRQNVGTLTIGNTKLENGFAFSTMAMTSGLWYWEITFTGSGTCGVSNGTAVVQQSLTSGSNTTYGFRFNPLTGVLSFTTNGSSYTNVGSPLAPGILPYTMIADSFTSAGAYVSYNSGLQPFTYAVPTGFDKLNSYNLPNAGILTGNTNLNVTNYLGTGTNGQAYTYFGLYPSGSTMQPDLLWIKRKSGAGDWVVADSLRQPFNSMLFLNSRSPGTTSTSYVQSLNANGFTVGNDITVNRNTDNYTSYGWKANGSTYTTPTQGTISSSSSTNTTNGFSIVNYTGTGVTGTVGHGLNVAPEFIITKQYNGPFFRGWAVYHKQLGPNSVLFIDSTGSPTTNSIYWNNTAPTSTVFTVGTATEVNESARSYVAYCWNSVIGYSSVGSWTGSGNAATGPFVYTGFQPAFLMYKGNNIGNWIIIDGQNNPTNSSNQFLNPNLDTGVQTGNKVDLLSNGFKISTADADTNELPFTYYYIAFAAFPLSIATAR
jgi:hypothetical protein